ncbi:ABC transporter permease subunit [Alteromonas sp. 5E99-2]|uniref:ABC transporter permease n=1 Tax=Alteromonas sp. 5E99-2 TaxID=2817683 RepID=UPI001A9A0CA5|nr:ABC transporter permease subunit [Alteromonas sp. 5E99-2]MBO1254906.1 ABC transporter permease subunit [Alteromonas sp. 5E99-2]
MTINKWPAVLLCSLIILPALGGSIAVVLPAFGYLPALEQTQFTFSIFNQLFSSQGFYSSVRLTIMSSVFSILIAVITSLIFAAYYYEKRKLASLSTSLRPLLVLPHAAAAIAIGFVLAPSGILIRMLSPDVTGFVLPPSWAIPNDGFGLVMTLSLALKEIPFIMLLMVSVIYQVQRTSLFNQYVSAAQSLGYSAFSSFILILWPQIYPLIRLPIFAVLVYTSASIEIPLILGPSSPSTIAITLLTSLNDVDLQQRLTASALAVVQILVSVVSIFIWIVIEKLGEKSRLMLAHPNKANTIFAPIKYIVRLLFFIIVGFMLIAFFGICLLSIAGHWPFKSVLPLNFTLQNWMSAIHSIQTPLFNGLWIGLTVALVCLGLCVTTLEATSSSIKLRALVTKLIYVPLLIPMVVFMFGASFIVTLYFEFSPIFSVLLLHFVVVAPYVWIALVQQYEDLDPRLISVAKTLGASQMKVFVEVKLPLLKQTFAVAFALGASISFSQYLPTLLGGSGNIDTITTEAVALASGGSRRLISVYSLIQIIMPMVVFSIANLISGRGLLRGGNKLA